MIRTKEIINTLLVGIFNDILRIEENALKSKQLNDVTITEVHTIEAIGMYDPLPSSEVAKKIGITMGTLTSAINNLVKKGYVERARSEEDRRLVMLSLTRKGKLLFRVHYKFHSDMVKNTITGLDKNEEEVLVKSLENLNKFFTENYSLDSKR